MNLEDCVKENLVSQFCYNDNLIPLLIANAYEVIL